VSTIPCSSVSEAFACGFRRRSEEPLAIFAFLGVPFVGGVDALRFPFVAFLGGMVRMLEFEKLFESFGRDSKPYFLLIIERDRLMKMLVSLNVSLNINQQLF